MDCSFCKKNIRDVDFRETIVLKRFISGLGKIRSRKRTYLCAFHQRQVGRAIKRARHLGLLAASSK